VSDNTKSIRRKSTVGGSSPETLSQGIKRTAGSHPRESVSGELPRKLAHAWKTHCAPARPCARHSALSAAYASQGIKRTAGSHPGEAYAADKTWTTHDRWASAEPGVPCPFGTIFQSWSGIILDLRKIPIIPRNSCHA